MKRHIQKETAIRHSLYRWFEKNKRSLPWRRNRTPYRVWVSEIMLQQTRVDQALPYYKAFMKSFPSIKRLAESSQHDVLKHWEGLGYYGRARKLHEAAIYLHRNCRGRFPDTYEGLLALPGVGPYTAAAIASLAMDLPHAVVDGNVVRVLSRLFCIKDSFDTGAGKKRFAVLADLFLEGAPSPGLHNESLMELGALICLPSKPLCDKCPLQRYCLAFKRGYQEQFPKRITKKKVPHIHVGAGVIVDSKKRVLIAQRHQQDMLGGLWEFPGGKQKEKESIRQCIQRELKEELGIEVDVGKHLTTIQHAYSHFTMDLHVYWGKRRSGRCRNLDCADFKWVHLAELDAYPMSKADDRIRTLLGTSTPEV